MPERLSDEQLRDALASLPEWHSDASALRRTVELPDFPTAIEAVRKVADVAEQMNHHPDIDIRYRMLTFVCSTHSAGGVTEFDAQLAHRIDEIVGG